VTKALTTKAEQPGQAAAEPREEAGPLGLRDVPDGRHRLLRGLGDALRPVQQPGQADDQPERAAVQGAGARRVEVGADYRELVQRSDKARPDRLGADEPEHRHHDQQQREDRGEPVPGQRDDQ
jgi:hypothetical protein